MLQNLTCSNCLEIIADLSLEIQRASTEIFHYNDKVQSKKEKAPTSGSQSSLTQTCEFTCFFPDKLTLQSILVYFEGWFRIFE